MPVITDTELAFLKRKSGFFKNVPEEAIAALLKTATIHTYSANDYITCVGDEFRDPMIVLSGMIKMSLCSESGKRLTFILVTEGEGYNMMGPYARQTRYLEAVAMRETRCLRIDAVAFKVFVFSHPSIVDYLFTTLTGVMDIANTRILDMMEKKVEFRIMRVLASLYHRFGSPLLFTNAEVSELAGTTAESTIRTMAIFREKGIVETQRGKIFIKNPDALEYSEFGNIFLSSP